MIDINFYMAIAEFKRQLGQGNLHDKDAAWDFLEAHRSPNPVVFNIETTNACNMTCAHCPRTTLMTRPVKTMAPEVYRGVVNQLLPHPHALWMRWCRFAEKEYGVPQAEQSENAFFLYILPQVVVLHGYGDPLLDPRIPTYVGMLTERDIPTYFSCNPANINLKRMEQAFDNGLTYIKFSIDSLSDPARGKDSFARDYPNIMKVLDLGKHYKTQVIVTMIDLKRRGQKKEFAALQERFKDTGVYVYLKSADQAWMTGRKKAASIHWSEFCQIPWSSMTIKSDGLAASCEEDYNNEIILGDTKFKSLFAIWNGAKYTKLRRDHFDLTPGIHCTARCDMRKIGELL